MVGGSSSVAVTETSDFVPASSKDFLDIQTTIECGFTLKSVLDMIRTYSQMHHTDKQSQHNSIIWPVCLNGWWFIYELSACGFESRCSHLKHYYWSDILIESALVDFELYIKKMSYPVNRYII